MTELTINSIFYGDVIRGLIKAKMCTAVQLCFLQICLEKSGTDA